MLTALELLNTELGAAEIQVVKTDGGLVASLREPFVFGSSDAAHAVTDPIIPLQLVLQRARELLP